MKGCDIRRIADQRDRDRRRLDNSIFDAVEQHQRDLAAERAAKQSNSAKQR